MRRLPWAGPLASADGARPAGSAARIRAEATAAGAGASARRRQRRSRPCRRRPGRGSFMALEQRTFASSPPSVARAQPWHSREGSPTARVAAAVKHFPGIGRATRNTDRAAVAIDAHAGGARAAATSLPFRAAIAAGAPIVMISNATYPALDAKPAPWSPRIQSLLRHELGFDGRHDHRRARRRGRDERAVAASVAALAAQAGVDLLLLTGSEASSAAAFEQSSCDALPKPRAAISRLRPSLQRELRPDRSRLKRVLRLSAATLPRRSLATLRSHLQEADMTELAPAPGERATDTDGSGIAPIHHWIGGATVAGTSGRTSPVFNPATGRQSGAVDLASVEEVDQAVQAAKQAFASWRTVSLAQARRVAVPHPRARARRTRRRSRSSSSPSTARCSRTRWAR